MGLGCLGCYGWCWCCCLCHDLLEHEKSWWGLLVLRAITILLGPPADRSVSTGSRVDAVTSGSVWDLGRYLAVVLGVVTWAVLGAGISGKQNFAIASGVPLYIFRLHGVSLGLEGSGADGLLRNN